MHPLLESHLNLTRRQFFGDSGIRLGGLALAMLAGGATASKQANAAAANETPFPPLPGMPHFAPKAKALIYLHMNGGPAQIDLWDHKPKLAEFFDKDLPDSVRMGQRITTMTSGQARLPCAPSKFAFAQHGQHGAWVSELLPNLAGVADDLCIVKSMHTEEITHDAAITNM